MEIFDAIRANLLSLAVRFCAPGVSAALMKKLLDISLLAGPMPCAL